MTPDRRDALVNRLPESRARMGRTNKRSWSRRSFPSSRHPPPFRFTRAHRNRP